MKIDTQVLSASLADVPAIARTAEDLGFDTLWLAETQHDPFLPGGLLAEHTQQMHFGTAVAISFARSPTTLAYTAWDLAQASQGRFILGLGTQVKPHIERRFGMPWPASPLGKLREQIEAIRALWHSWQTGERLNFRGEYYKLTLMTPFFSPGPIDYPKIPIFIAGVNPGLAKLAGERADGFIFHPFHTRHYLQTALLPAIHQGASSAGRDPASVQRFVTAFAITGPEEREFVRQQISFYASTPSYRTVLAAHGWDQTGRALSALAARKQWDQMPSQISDEMLEAIAVIAAPADLPAALQARYGDLADHLSLYLPFVPGQRDAFWGELIQALKSS